MLKKLFFHSPFRYLASLIVMALIVVIYNLLRGEWSLIVNYHNSFFLAGMFLILIGLLSLVDFYGGFDIFRYMFVRKNLDGTKITLYEYSEDRKEKVKIKKYYFIPYVVVGVLSLIVSLIFLIFI